MVALRTESMMEQEWLQMKDAMRVLGLSRVTVLYHIEHKELAAYKMGKNVYRFRMSDLEAFIESKRTIPRKSGPEADDDDKDGEGGE